jgi:hypothetical protein
MKINRKQTLIYVLIIFILLVSISLYFINNFEKILYFPVITAEEWCDNQPCVQIELFSKIFILVQPSSTFFVYLLGFISAIIGLFLFKFYKTNNILAWWGVALILWGLGALFAGTSYQAFSYEIKCAGRTLCIWTSWWEIIYLMLSVGSMNAMMVAQANLSTKRKYKTAMRVYAFISFLGYTLIIIIGSLIPVQILISFELMVLFLVPNLIIFVLFNLKRLLKLKQSFNLYLLLIWVFLIIVMGAYFLYLLTGITEILWEHNIWFSENDVLHIGLIAWMLYIGFVMSKMRKNHSFE